MRILSTPVIKLTNDLVKNDEILVGGMLCVIAEIKINDHGHYVLHCEIVGSKTKKRNQLTLIIPDQTPVITFQ